jgi:glycosyltransferase involved in cell wall biosynthesis
MPSALVFYQFFYPDDVVSSVHLSELSEGLAGLGWDVTAMPSNRSCRNDSQKHPPQETWKNIRIERVWRPPLQQASFLGRIGNAMWMIASWSWIALTSRPPDAVILGTDPILSVLVARVWKWRHPKTRVAHWCFDLYPEAAIADGMLPSSGLAARTLRRLLAPAYRCCDMIVDIGSCMRRKLQEHGSKAKQCTIVPWALAEPPSATPVESTERMEVFGEAKLGLLYSGNFGRAHSYESILRLADRIAPAGARVAFSVRGNSVEELRCATAGRPYVRFVPFAAPDRLEARLSAADIHVVSLREAWTGTVVPSKFFGALAAGRPVLFAGSPDSAIAQWIREFRVGWVLTDETMDAVAAELESLCRANEKLRALYAHCHAVYQQNFSKSRAIEQWHRHLTNTSSI